MDKHGIIAILLGGIGGFMASDGYTNGNYITFSFGIFVVICGALNRHIWDDKT